MAVREIDLSCSPVAIHYFSPNHALELKRQCVKPLYCKLPNSDTICQYTKAVDPDFKGRADCLKRYKKLWGNDIEEIGLATYFNC